MRKFAFVMVTILAACSGGEEKVEKKAEAAAGLEPGLWEITSEVTDMKMADQGAPALPMKAGMKTTIRSCVTPEQAKEPQAAVFGATSGDCKYDSFYMSRGRLSTSMSCSQAGTTGKVMINVDGTYTGTSFETTSQLATYLPGSGDMKVSSKASGRRVADTCPADATGTEGPQNAT